MRFKIIADSSADITGSYYKGETAFDYGCVPMSINGPNHITLVDLEPVDAVQFALKPKEVKGPWSSSCPSPASYLKELQGAEAAFIVTISSRLSASYSTACMAADMARAENPGVKIHVVDSKMASAGTAHIVLKLEELIKAGLSFDEICSEIEAFRKTLTLYFLIGSLDTLISAGRVKRVAGMMASVLNIHPICGEDGDGNIKIYQKVRGFTPALNRMIEMLGERGDTQGKHLIITHCNNPEDAEVLKNAAARLYHFDHITVMPMRGLASFYAGDHGLIVSF